jgi:hypothetical protein
VFTHESSRNNTVRSSSCWYQVRKLLEKVYRNYRNMYVSKRLQSRPAAKAKSDLHEMYQIQEMSLAILPILLSLFVQTANTDP